MNKKNIFEQIIKGKIKSDIVYQDKIVTAFKDIKPKAPIHILIIPNVLIVSANQINEKNKDILTHVFITAIKIAKKIGIHEKGYRLVLNCNRNGGQEVPYLHLHLLGGKYLGSIL
ncbi:histidine triad nucleotide-binding protein [Buchnera aphidicola]|uniref:histidine triad nucleotide-binding protein n=1 Tax=Buchnera aphidicola TaxID=9 RepID=UPI003464BA5B